MEDWLGEEVFLVLLLLSSLCFAAGFYAKKTAKSDMMAVLLFTFGVGVWVPVLVWVSFLAMLYIGSFFR